MKTVSSSDESDLQGVKACCVAALFGVYASNADQGWSW